MLNKWSWDESLEEILLYLHIRDVSITIEIIIGVKVLCHRASCSILDSNTWTVSICFNNVLLGFQPCCFL